MLCICKYYNIKSAKMEVGMPNIYELFLIFLHTLIGARFLFSFGAVFAVLSVCAPLSFPRLCATPISSIPDILLLFGANMQKISTPKGVLTPPKGEL